MVLFSERTFELAVTISHFANGVFFLLAPSVGAAFFAKAGYTVTPSDVGAGFWFGIWLITYAYAFAYGTRSKLANQTFFLLAFLLCFVQTVSGNAQAFDPLKVLPYIIIFGAASAHHARVLKPFEVPKFFTNELSTLQNIYRLLAFVLSMLNGIGYTFAPDRVGELYQWNAMVAAGESLAFMSFNGAMMIALATIIIGTTNKIFLRNLSILGVILRLLVVLLHPEASSPRLYSYIVFQIVGAAVCHF